MRELPDRHAAVIGIDAYGHGVAPLSSAVSDARAIADALESDHGYSAHLLLDAAATREGILRLLEETLPRGLGADSGVVIYYAGHGLAVGDGSGSPQGFLVPQDARLDDEETWLSMERIRQSLDELPCRHLLVMLDCSYAGSFRWARRDRAFRQPDGAGTASTRRTVPPIGPPLYDNQYYRYLLGSAWQVLTSASHDEKAVHLAEDNRGEEGPEGHSPFAAALLRGLAGDADSSRGRHDADGVITATELFQYIFEELVLVEDWPQTPGLWPLKPDNTGEFIFLSPRQGTAETRLLRAVWQAAVDWDQKSRAEEWLWDDDPRLPQLREMSGELNQLEREFLGASLDAARVALASEWMSEDPTRAALVLREVVNVEAGGAFSAMLDALAQPLAAAVFPDSGLGAFSADGKKILTSSTDGIVRVWNADGCGPPVALRGHEAWVMSGVFSADGTKVLTSSGDGTARVWNADGTGVPVVLRGHEEPVASAVFDADGTRVVTASWDGTARVWNVDGSGVPVILRGHEGAVEHAVFNAAGTKVLTAGGTTARVWNADGSGLPVVLRGHGDWVWSAVFNAAETRVLTCSHDGTARIWNAGGSGEPAVLEGHEGGVASASFNADDTRILTCSADKTARVWNAFRASRPVVLRGHEDEVRTARFNAGGTGVVTASADGTARVWNADGSAQPRVLRGHRGLVYRAAFNADGSRVVTASDDGTVRVWSVGPREPVVLRGHEAGLTSAAFNSAGTKVVTASDDRTARVWNVDGSGEPVILRGHRELVWSAAFDATGTRVVTWSEDRTVRVWNVDGSGQPLVLQGETAVFNATGTKIVTVTIEDGTARVWNVDGAGEPVVLRGHEDLLWSAAFNAAGDKIVTASLDRTARVWSSDGSEKPLVLAHEDNVGSAAFNAAGTRVVTASDDGTARVWSIDGPRGALGEPVVLRGHESVVLSAVFNADGTRVLTASADQTARLWNVDGSGRPVVLRGHTEALFSAAFNAAGTRVLTVSGDGTAQVWNVAGPEGRPPGPPLVLRHRQEPGDLSAAFDAAGTRVVTASSDATARVWTIDAAILQDTLGSVTSACLDPEFRVEFLGESPETAWERYSECESRHGRRPRRRSDKPSRIQASDLRPARPRTAGAIDKAASRFKEGWRGAQARHLGVKR